MLLKGRRGVFPTGLERKGLGADAPAVSVGLYYSLLPTLTENTLDSSTDVFPSRM